MLKASLIICAILVALFLIFVIWCLFKVGADSDRRKEELLEHSPGRGYCKKCKTHFNAIEHDVLAILPHHWIVACPHCNRTVKVFIHRN